MKKCSKTSSWATTGTSWSPFWASAGSRWNSPCTWPCWSWVAQIWCINRLWLKLTGETKRILIDNLVHHWWPILSKLCSNYEIIVNTRYTNIFCSHSCLWGPKTPVQDYLFASLCLYIIWSWLELALFIMIYWWQNPAESFKNCSFLVK